METKMIYLSYQKSKYNEKGERYYDEPETVCIIYNDSMGKITKEQLVLKLDEMYKQLRGKFLEEAENDK